LTGFSFFLPENTDTIAIEEGEKSLQESSNSTDFDPRKHVSLSSPIVEISVEINFPRTAWQQGEFDE
jgi:hypothetical protein